MTKGEKAAATTKANKEKRRMKEAQQQAERKLIHDSLLAVLEDETADATAKVRAAELLREYRF